MTHRIPLDDLTSDQLDQLHDALDRVREQRHRYHQALQQKTSQVHAQQATLARVRALRDDLRGTTGARYIADALDTILDGQQTVTEATGPASWLLAGIRDLSIPPTAVPCPACRRADQAGLADTELHHDCAKEQ